ncbi:MAG: adenosine-specific kinase [Candidatus Altiarchaeota archaeon]|nr:adenosine-specific kinase [Candidatus Altiarchaeota archaeon]
MEIKSVDIEKPPEVNLILGQSHFIKTVEDLYEVLITAVPRIEFGLAFCEASGDLLVRIDGTDKGMMDLAAKNAERIAAGHSFIIFLKNAFPINVLNAVKNVPEVCRIYAATANPLQVIIAETERGRGILGVIDGKIPVGVESLDQMKERKDFLRRIGYKK